LKARENAGFELGGEPTTICAARGRAWETETVGYVDLTRFACVDDKPAFCIGVV